MLLLFNRPRSDRGTLVPGTHHGQCELLLDWSRATLHALPGRRTYLRGFHPRPVSRTLSKHFCMAGACRTSRSPPLPAAAGSAA